MVRTQIYLTDEERRKLAHLAKKHGRTQSELIREAVDTYVARQDVVNRKEVLARAAGLWKHRKDLPDFAALRREAERKARR
jgi:predicted transcriptional regulator